MLIIREKRKMEVKMYSWEVQYSDKIIPNMEVHQSSDEEVGE